MSIVYLNGKFIAEEQASISPLDRGFIFGDGVYEVIPVYGGNAFRIAEHLHRLHNSLTAIRLPNPYTGEQWQSIINNIIEQNGGGDQSIYLQVTRGKAVRDHAIPDSVNPTVFMMCTTLNENSAETLAKGVSIVTCDDFRWQKCHIKSISLIANVLLRQYALDNDASEAVLVRDGNITEGAASNIFVVMDDTLLTPPKGPLLLPGITRDLILELAQQADIKHREQAISLTNLGEASEIMLTSSTKEILPVTRLNQQAVGSAKPGPLFHKLYSSYQHYKQQIRNKQK